MVKKLEGIEFCPNCGGKLSQITTKTAQYKGVCLHCEITYRVDDGILSEKNSTEHQLTEAMISK